MKRRFTVLIAAVLGLIIFAACGGTNSAPGQTSLEAKDLLSQIRQKGEIVVAMEAPGRRGHIMTRAMLWWALTSRWRKILPISWA